MKLSDISRRNKKRVPHKRAQRIASTILLVDLRGMRSEYGLSLRDLQTATKLDVATMSRVEAGATPSLDNALRIAELFGLPVEKIWAVRKERP